MWLPCCSSLASNGGQKGDKHCYSACNFVTGWFWHISIGVRQRWCGQNLRGLFLKAILLTTVRSVAWAMADNGKTKGLRTLPPRWVSVRFLYVRVSAWWRSHWCSQNLHRSFLWALRFFIYTTLHYIAQFSLYQECNFLNSESTCLGRLTLLS